MINLCRVTWKSKKKKKTKQKTKQKQITVDDEDIANYEDSLDKKKLSVRCVCR